MNIENATRADIRFYLHVLHQSLGIREPISEKALKILFETNLFGECVLGIMRKMGLSNKVKVICYSNEKYPRPGSAAYIDLPVNMPLFGSKQFKEILIPVCIKKEITYNYDTFVITIAHELAHIVLHSTKSKLRMSEVATDLFVLLSGFQRNVIKGRKVITENEHEIVTSTYGYLTDDNFSYALSYIEKIRKGKKSGNWFDTFSDLFFDLKSRLFNKRLFYMRF